MDIIKRTKRKLRVEEGFTYNDKVFQIDDVSRTNIAGKYNRVVGDSAITTVRWKALDNTVVEFSREEFIQFAFAVSDYYEYLILDY